MKFKGFTLIELLIVLGIISLLTAVVIRVSFDGLIHARALQVAVNLTGIMKAAQAKLLSPNGLSFSIEDLGVSLQNPERYQIEMNYNEADSTVFATASYSGTAKKEVIKEILEPDSAFDDQKAYYIKSFYVGW